MNLKSLSQLAQCLLRHVFMMRYNQRASIGETSVGRTRSRQTRLFVLGACAALVLGSGCERSKSSVQETKSAPNQAVAVATMSPTEGNEVKGTVRFEQTADGVVVHAELTGLEPKTMHGFHIHEKGDCSAPDASSAGGHYAPNGNPHGLPPEAKRHAGDMGNIVADEKGSAIVERTFDTFSLTSKDPVMGRAVIVHGKADDGTQPTGDAGARLACGVIEPSQSNPN